MDQHHLWNECTKHKLVRFVFAGHNTIQLHDCLDRCKYVSPPNIHTPGIIHQSVLSFLSMNLTPIDSMSVMLKYRNASVLYVSGKRKEAAAYFLPRCVISFTPNTETREDSLSIAMKSFPSGGSTLLMAWGKIINFRDWNRVSPSA